MIDRGYYLLLRWCQVCPRSFVDDDTDKVGVRGPFVAAGIDDSFAVNSEGQVYAWGFSDGYRTGLGTDETVDTPTLVRGKALDGLRVVGVGCGGQFSVITAVANDSGPS